MNVKEARGAIYDARKLVERGGDLNLVDAQLRRAQDALQATAADEVESTVETTIVNRDETEQLVADRLAGLVEAYGSGRFHAALPTGPMPDKLLERMARVEVAIENLVPGHTWTSVKVN